MDDWIVFGAFAAACVAAIAVLIGGELYESRLIAKSADPIATACALGKKQVCVILAARR